MIMMWPCEAEGCGVMVTNPEGCLEHAPDYGDETFEEEFLRVMMNSTKRTDGVVISGMRFK